MRGLFPPTPLLRNDYLSGSYGADIWLKREDLSPVRSYKIRGAFNAMRKVRAERPGADHFVCASAGNHAQGVAYACRHFGVRGTIFMPVTTPQQKIDKTRTFGGDAVEIRLVGDYFDDTLTAAQALLRRGGRAFPVAVRRPRRDRGTGAASRSRSSTSSARRPTWWCCRSAAAGCPAGMRRYLAADGAGDRDRLCRAGGRREPGRGAGGAGAPVTLPRVDTFVDGAAVARIGERDRSRR